MTQEQKPTRPAIPRLVSSGGAAVSAPAGADKAALADVLADAIAAIESSRKAFDASLNTLAEDVKTTRGDVADIKGVVMRMDATLANLAKVVGTWPEPVDPAEVIARLQTQSVQDMTHDEIISREERVREELEARSRGTGLCAIVARGAEVDRVISERVMEIAKAELGEMAAGAKTQTRKMAATVGVTATGSVAAILAMLSALGPENARIINATIKALLGLG